MSESTNKSGHSDADVLAALVTRKLISQAQADLVKSNSEAMSMSILELLIARRWINEDVLAKVLAEEATQAGVSATASVAGKADAADQVSAGDKAGAPSSTGSSKAGSTVPASQATPKDSASALSQPLSDDYNENLARYKKLIAKILREDGTK